MSTTEVSIGRVAVSQRPRGALTEGYITPAELKVWRHVAMGHGSKTIAALTGTGIKTVDKHRCELMRKLGVHNAADLTRLAVEHAVIAVEIRPLQTVNLGTRGVFHLLPQ